MTDKVLTIRLSEDDHRALKLHAVLRGRSVQAVVLDLIKAELASGSSAAGGLSREDFVAQLLARAGIDPASPEFRAAAERADASIRRRDGRRGAAEDERTPDGGDREGVA
jgi:hypothetical protein